MSSRHLEALPLGLLVFFAYVLGVRQTLLTFSLLPWGPKWLLEDRQITHLICVRLRHLLYDFCRCFGLSYKKNNWKEAQNSGGRLTTHMIRKQSFVWQMCVYLEN